MTKQPHNSAETLRATRQAAKLTQVQLAGLLGIRQSQVADYEGGRHEPRAELYLRWLKICQEKTE